MASTEQLRKLYPDLNDQDLGEIKKRFAEYLQLAALVFQERNTGNVHHEDQEKIKSKHLTDGCDGA